MEQIDKKIIGKMQKNIPISKRPYKIIADELGILETELINRLKKMEREGKLRRVGAILKHRKAGFEANAMIAWKVPENKVDEVGEIMAGFKEASHVYLRPTYPEWPYNMFTMIHSIAKEECENTIKAMAFASGIKEYKYLYSIKEYKKTSMEYF